MELDFSDKNGVNVDCSWSADSGCQDLRKVVKFSSKSSYNLDDIVQVESCVHLCCSGPNIVPCNITVKLDIKSPFAITKVDIVSEARIIECYGSCEEYTNTIHGELMDDFEGSTVYSASSSFPPSQEISLKFARMKDKREMWLYGLMFTVEQYVEPRLKFAGINLSNVNDILKESSRPISDKAENCKKLLQQCCSNIDSNGSIDPQVLLKMFEGEYLRPLGETSKSMSKCLMRLIPFIINKTGSDTVNNGDYLSPNKNPAQRELSPDSPVASSVISSNDIKVNNNNNNIHVVSDSNIEDYIKIMKDYIDKRINDMEEMLTNKLEQRLRDIEIAQNNKLDSIMKLLLKK